MAWGRGRGRRLHWWVGGVVMVVGLAWGVAALWVHVPALYASVAPEHGRAQAIALTRTGVLTAGAALLALAGVLLNLLENRRSTNLTHARELYTEAVGQLGSDNLHVRLGGIYALERIATDYAADHRTVVEVLSAFVREHTTPGRPGAARRGRRTALPTPAERADGAAARSPGELDTDIQAALTALGRLPTRSGVARADLTGAHLAGAHLDGANLTGARLVGANLTGAWLHKANLRGAELSLANLSKADLRGAELSGADLFGTELSGANLVATKLSGAVNLGRARGLIQSGRTSFIPAPGKRDRS